MQTHNFTVAPPSSGKRLDVYLVEAGLGLSRRRIRQIIDVGGVYVNKRRIRIASRQVQTGDKVRVEYSEAGLKQLRTQKVTLKQEDLILERPGLFVINKPPGLPSQATLDQTIMHVVPALAAVLTERGDAAGRKLILVHRLDKETSGVMLVADGAKAATWLTEQFRERKIKKTYLAICYGIPKQTSFTESAHLSEIDKRTGDVRPVHAGGRTAVTHFRLLAKNPELGLSLLQCNPETGRSHQIRVHLQMNGLPLVGDKRYRVPGTKELAPALADLTAVHHFLHAFALDVVPGPGEEHLVVTGQPPERFARFLELAGFKLPMP